MTCLGYMIASIAIVVAGFVAALLWVRVQGGETHEPDEHEEHYL